MDGECRSKKRRDREVFDSLSKKYAQKIFEVGTCSIKDAYLSKASEVPRRPRPGYVLHRVGEVIMETQNHMVGVIVGWDEGLRAPPEWLRRKKYTDSEVKRLENTPHYKILFSGPDPSSLMIGYLPQNVLQLFEGYMPEIPTLEQYFSHFNGEKFVMLDWLKALYPED